MDLRKLEYDWCFLRKPEKHVSVKSTNHIRPEGGIQKSSIWAKTAVKVHETASKPCLHTFGRVWGLFRAFSMASSHFAAAWGPFSPFWYIVLVGGGSVTGIRLLARGPQAGPPPFEHHPAPGIVARTYWQSTDTRIQETRIRVSVHFIALQSVLFVTDFDFCNRV